MEPRGASEGLILLANHLSQDQQERLIRALGKGVPIRHIAHILDIHIDTVARYVRLAGQMAIDFIDVVQKDMEMDTIEVDEFYSFVAAKRENVANMKTKVEGAGQAVHYLAVKPNTAFIVEYRVAPTNDLTETTEFIRDLGKRLKRGPDGEFTVKPTVISDGYISYESAISDVWKGRMNHRKLIKIKTNVDENGKKTRWRFKGVLRETPIGDLADEEFWQNNVESANRTARAQNRRVARRSNAFSKRLDPHIHQFAFWIFYHNYVNIPKRRKVTPAMEAGVVNRLYDAAFVVRMIARYQARAIEEGLLTFDEDVVITPRPADEMSPSVDDQADPLWLYRNFAQHSVRIHKASCAHARKGAGHGGEVGRSGEWIQVIGLENARTMGEEIAPGRTSICNICLGQRFNLGRRL